MSFDIFSNPSGKAKKGKKGRSKKGRSKKGKSRTTKKTTKSKKTKSKKTKSKKSSAKKGPARKNPKTSTAKKGKVKAITAASLPTVVAKLQKKVRSHSRTLKAHGKQLGDFLGIVKTEFGLSAAPGSKLYKAEQDQKKAEHERQLADKYGN